jgi:lyso-ornithine lipid O-acyltransferase
MKRVIKAFRFVSVTLFFLARASTVHFFSSQKNNDLSFLLQRWAAAMNKILGVSVEYSGDVSALQHQPQLIVSNHQSYLDIVAVASIVPTLFVAKSDVQRWPGIGVVTKIGGTIFINRRSLRSGIATSAKIAEALRKGTNVHFFPEGTSTNGETVLPFKPSLFGAAPETGVSVLSISIIYTTLNGNSMSDKEKDIVCWYGDMEFAGHFWNLLSMDSIGIHVTVHDRIKAERYSSPREIAVAAHAAVLSGLTEVVMLQQQAEKFPSAA